MNKKKVLTSASDIKTTLGMDLQEPFKLTSLSFTATEYLKAVFFCLSFFLHIVPKHFKQKELHYKGSIWAVEWPQFDPTYPKWASEYMQTFNTYLSIKYHS